MFRLIAFLIVCLVSAAAYFLLPGVPIPAKTMHQQAQQIAAKAEQKLQEYTRPTAVPPPAPDPIPVEFKIQTMNSAGTRPERNPISGPSSGETAAIYARIITAIDQDGVRHRRR